MIKKQVIRITETRVYEYAPDFAEDAYAEEQITDLQSALNLDEADYRARKLDLVELGGEPESVHTTFEIVEVDRVD